MDRKAYMKIYNSTDKAKASKQIYLKNNPNKRKETTHNYYINNKEERNASTKRDYFDNRIYYLRKAAKNIQEKKTKLFMLLGGVKCIKCGFDRDYRALVIEHKNNDGHEDKKKFKTTLRKCTYYLEHPDEAKEKLQVYCANCNTIKEFKRIEKERKERHSKS
jgi:hypothetical protein